MTNKERFKTDKQTNRQRNRLNDKSDKQKEGQTEKYKEKKKLQSLYQKTTLHIKSMPVKDVQKYGKTACPHVQLCNKQQENADLIGASSIMYITIDLNSSTY